MQGRSLRAAQGRRRFAPSTITLTLTGGTHRIGMGGRVPVSRKNYLDEEIDETVNNVLF